MIVLSRSLARQFRAVLRRLLQDADQRNQWPFLVCRADKHGMTLQARCGDLGVRYRHAGGQTPETLIFQASLLAGIEGRADTPVELASVSAQKGKARFDDSGVPKAVDFDLVMGNATHEWPSLPREMVEQPPEFLAALREAARTCAPASGRFALSRVQLRGKDGEVTATDGKQLLVQRGFTMPWSDDVLIPRLSAFACREMNCDGPIGLGRTDKHVVLRIGPWTFLLTIDATSRYPDVATVIPRANGVSSRWHIDEADAGHLINILPKLPGSNDAHAPVTLDFDRECVLRARGDDQEAVAEVPLSGSTLSGPPVRFCVDRSFLRRALELGFRKLHVAGPDKPLSWRDERRLYVVMTLDKGSVILAGSNVLRVSSRPGAASSTATPSDERKNAIMPAPPPNRPPDNNHGTTTAKGNDPAQPPRYGIDELIDDAERLRASLHDASVRVSRLLAALKLQRRQVAPFAQQWLRCSSSSWGRNRAQRPASMTGPQHTAALQPAPTHDWSS